MVHVFQVVPYILQKCRRNTAVNVCAHVTSSRTHAIRIYTFISLPTNTYRLCLGPLSRCHPPQSGNFRNFRNMAFISAKNCRKNAALTRYNVRAQHRSQIQWAARRSHREELQVEVRTKIEVQRRRWTLLRLNAASTAAAADLQMCPRVAQLGPHAIKLLGVTQIRNCRLRTSTAFVFVGVILAVGLVWNVWEHNSNFELLDLNPGL